MRNSIRGLEQWEGEAREFSRKAGRLRMKAGSGMIGALESWYQQWEEKPTPRAQREYMVWRLRLHVRWNEFPEFLEELNDAFHIGLYDEEVGQTFWKVKPEARTSITTGYNWRRDSGEAIRGRTPRSQQPEEQPEDI